MIRRALTLLCLLAACCGPRRRISKEPTNPSGIEKTTICEIVKDPRRFDNMRVSVSGCVTTDGKEYVTLSDISQCVAGGLVPIESKVLLKSKRYEVRPDERVCGVFTGTFRLATVVYDRVLEVEDTSNLHTRVIQRH
jgi:hypothetical protein